MNDLEYYCINKDRLPECFQKAYELLAMGYEPTYSTGICESLTCGFGELDGYGYWEFPLMVDQEYNQFITLKQYLGE